MAIRYENDCCGCAVPAYPCLGESCPLQHQKHYYCDNCHEEADKLYRFDGEMNSARVACWGDWRLWNEIWKRFIHRQSDFCRRYGRFGKQFFRKDCKNKKAA